MTEQKFEYLIKQLQEFSNWLEARARTDEEDFRKKHWNVKTEARAIKEKFDEVFEKVEQ